MGVFRQQGEVGVEAKQVLEDNLGSRLSELEDIMDYLISIVEESSNDLDESVETLASMLEGAVDEDTAIVSRKIIEHYNSSNELHSSGMSNWTTFLCRMAARNCLWTPLSPLCKGASMVWWAATDRASPHCCDIFQVASCPFPRTSQSFTWNKKWSAMRRLSCAVCWRLIWSWSNCGERRKRSWRRIQRTFDSP